MRPTTKVRVSNGSGGSVSGDLQIEICGMRRCVTSLLRPSRGSLYPLSPICSIAKTLISLGLRSGVFLARDKELLAPKRADNLSGLSSDDCGEEALAESSTSDDWPVDARHFSCRFRCENSRMCDRRTFGRNR